MLTTEQDEESTRQFLKTNGPPPGIFAPDASLEPLLEGKGELEKRFYRSQSTQGKQNDYLISQGSGFKAALRSVHSRLEDGEARFIGIEGKLQVFDTLREKYLNRRKMIRNITVAVVSLFFLPFLSVLAVEVVKRLLHWP